MKQRTGNIELELLLKIVSLLAIIFVLLFGLDNNIAPVSYFFILILNCYMIIKSYNNFFMFFIMLIIGYSNYSIISANYITIIDSMYTEQITKTISQISLNILLLFNCFLFILMKWSFPNTPSMAILRSPKPNTLAVLSLFAILVTIFFWGYSIPEQFGEAGSPKPVYEYSIVLFILYFYYSSDNRSFQLIGLLLVLLYSFQNFVFGGRILGIQFLMCAFVFLYLNRFKMKFIVAAIVLFFVFFSIIGSVRGALLAGDFDVKSILLYTMKQGFALDTAYSAYYASMAFLFMKSFLQEAAVTQLFFDFIKSIFLGTSSDLRALSMQYVIHTGGGVYPFYFYFYLNVLGILISVIILVVYFRIILKMSPRSHGLVKCIAIFVTCHAFRWYLYNPLGLFRAVLFLCLFYFFFDFSYRIINKRSKRISR